MVSARRLLAWSTNSRARMDVALVERRASATATRPGRGGRLPRPGTPARRPRPTRRRSRPRRVARLRRWHGRLRRWHRRLGLRRRRLLRGRFLWSGGCDLARPEQERIRSVDARNRGRAAVEVDQHRAVAVRDRDEPQPWERPRTFAGDVDRARVDDGVSDRDELHVRRVTTRAALVEQRELLELIERSDSIERCPPARATARRGRRSISYEHELARSSRRRCARS